MKSNPSKALKMNINFPHLTAQVWNFLKNRQNQAKGGSQGSCHVDHFTVFVKDRDRLGNHSFCYLAPKTDVRRTEKL